MHLSAGSRGIEPNSRYRSAVSLPIELRNHCHIYLDEEIYSSALALLTDLVMPGSSHPKLFSALAFSPLPSHIEIVSTLLVHPAYTTQLPRNERIELASRSITFLRGLLDILGPINGNLGEAFSLTPRNPRVASRGRRGADEGNEADNEYEIEHIKGIVAYEGSLRRCARDFWHIVGWAFNCSVVHHKRWRYWKVWLAYMLDVLDADWIERESLDIDDENYQAKLQQSPQADCSHERLRKSLVVEYLSDVRGRTSVFKRVVAAVFTDGGREDLRLFPEVFKNETADFNALNGQKRKRGAEVDFGGFGSGYDEYSSDPTHSNKSTPKPSQSADREEGRPDPWLGGPESIFLRQRVLALLSRTAATLPDCSISISELYNLYSLNLRRVPLPAFSLLLSPSHFNPFPLVAFISLTQVLQKQLLPNNIPRPDLVLDCKDDLTQATIEKYYLPYAASTSSVEDNAKVSIIAENMLRIFMQNTGIHHTSTLKAAIEEGIQARERKIKGEGRLKGRWKSKTDEEDKKPWLIASGKRLMSILAWVESGK